MKHDDVLIQRGLGARLALGEGAYDGLPEAPIFTEPKPFDEELEDSPTYQASLEWMASEAEVSKPFVDIRPLDENDPKLFMEKSFHRMWHTMQPLTRFENRPSAQCHTAFFVDYLEGSISPKILSLKNKPKNSQMPEKTFSAPVYT